MTPPPWGWRAVLAAATTGAVLALAPVTAQGAVTRADAERVTIRSGAVAGTLRMAAQTTGARTTVTARGTLTTRSASVRVAAYRCGDASCSARRLTAIGGRTLARGRAQHRLSWATGPAARVRVRVRVGRGTLVSAVLRIPPAATGAPVGGQSVPAPAATAPAAPAPAPAALAVVTDPGLVPAYDPAVPDYTVRCAPLAPVRVTATLPAGRTIAIDGAPAVSGTVAQDVALAPGEAFAFTLDGGERHVVRCLPADFPLWTTERAGHADTPFVALSPTLNIGPGTTGYAVIADRYGVPVWWRTADSGPVNNVEVLRDGTVAIGVNATGTVGFSRYLYERYALDGTARGTASTAGVGADLHDIVGLPNGNLLVEAYPTREHVDLTALGGPADAAVLDALIQEVRPDGTVAWEWNSKDHIALEESAGWPLPAVLTEIGGQAVYDIVHLNSVEPTAGGDVIISARHLDAVYRLRRSDGSVAWKLGGTPTPQSLAIAGDAYPALPLSGQHDARLLADGTLTLHENGTRGGGRPPRALRFALDPAAGTATELEDVRDARVTSAFCCGSARRLPGGHWLMGWAAARSSPSSTRRAGRC